MIRIETLKEQYIDSVLANTDFNFKIFTNAGEYKTATRENNTVNQYINGVFSVVQPDTQVLANNVKAYALETTLSFTIPLKPFSNSNNEFVLPKELNKNGETKTLDEFYLQISKAFESAGSVLSITEIDEDENTVEYIGGIGYNLPIPQSLAQRQLVGHSIDFRVSIAFAFLPNGMSSQNVHIELEKDGVIEDLSAMNYEISRTPALQSDIFKDGQGEASNYAESTSLQISCNVPIFSGSIAESIVFGYLDGGTANTPVKVRVYYDTTPTKTILTQRKMILGGARVSGGGVNNLTAQISFVPYTETQIDG